MDHDYLLLFVKKLHLKAAFQMNLNAYVGQQIASLLPKPDELAEAMQGGFTKANS